MSDAFNQKFPADLAALLGDSRLVLPGESDLLEMIAEWSLATSDTPSAAVDSSGDMVADLQAWASAASSTTPAAV